MFSSNESGPFVAEYYISDWIQREFVKWLRERETDIYEVWQLYFFFEFGSDSDGILWMDSTIDYLRDKKFLHTFFNDHFWVSVAIYRERRKKKKNQKNSRKKLTFFPYFFFF